ncbi:hypothetical protein ABUE34_12950 [Kozakia baliensis]|uniref:hypothetical protein n=1 Tax=Kozakia baliensis TaxID=153496 RepID=UPI00345B9DF7
MTNDKPSAIRSRYDQKRHMANVLLSIKRSDKNSEFLIPIDILAEEWINEAERRARMEKSGGKVSRDLLQDAAKSLLVKNGWKPGDKLHYPALIALLVEFGASVSKGEGQCDFPSCGCDDDAKCDAPPMSNSMEKSGEAVCWVDEGSFPNEDFPHLDATLWASDQGNDRIIPLYTAPQPDAQAERVKELEAALRRIAESDLFCGSQTLRHTARAALASAPTQGGEE